MGNAKQRVEQELAELNEKIVKLTAFLFGDDIVNMDIADNMRFLLRRQLNVMQEYADVLQERLRTWDKTDEEIKNEMHLKG
nr:MAG TPA: hypothetical protein [Bacteriophage sp.]